MNTFKLGLTCLIILLASLQAKSETYYYFQNNSSLSFAVSSSQFGTHTMDPSEWTGMNGTISPWQPDTEVLRSNRDQGIHNGDDFFFDVQFASATDTFVLQLQLNGNFVGSDMSHSAKGPGFNHAWYTDSNFHSETFNMDGKSFTLKYTAFFTGGYDDVRFALQENQPYSVAPTDTNGISIYAYNIYCLSSPIALSDQVERSTEIPNHVHDYDVLIISEAFDNNARDNYLIPGLSVEYPFYTNVVDEAGSLEDGGVMIFSKWPIEYARDSVFQDCDGSDCLAAKGVMYAKINKGGKKYHIFGTHTQAWESPAGSAVRLAQFRTIRNFIDQQNIPAGEPVLVGGDLNVDKYKNYLSEWDSTLAILNADTVLATGHPYTWDADVNYYADGAPPEYLDYVLNISDFAAPDSSFNEARILRSIADDVWDIFDLSDHFGVYGRFIYPALITSLEEASSAGIPENEPKLVAWPNPFKERISINLEATPDSRVEVAIYNMKGQLVRQLVSMEGQAGLFQFEWDGYEAGKSVPAAAGMYLIRARVGQSYLSSRILKQ